MTFENAEKFQKIYLILLKSNKLKLGKEIFILISNDANHYGEDFNNVPYGCNVETHNKATMHDKIILNNFLIGRLSRSKIKDLAKEILQEENKRNVIPLLCGRYPIIFGLFTLLNITEYLHSGEVHGKLFKYSDTFTKKVLPFYNSTMGLTAPFSLKHWVGFFTLGYYIK